MHASAKALTLSLVLSSSLHVPLFLKRQGGATEVSGIHCLSRLCVGGFTSDGIVDGTSKADKAHAVQRSFSDATGMIISQASALNIMSVFVSPSQN